MPLPQLAYKVLGRPSSLMVAHTKKFTFCSIYTNIFQQPGRASKNLAFKSGVVFKKGLRKLEHKIEFFFGAQLFYGHLHIFKDM